MFLCSLLYVIKDIIIWSISSSPSFHIPDGTWQNNRPNNSKHPSFPFLFLKVLFTPSFRRSYLRPISQRFPLLRVCRGILRVRRGDNTGWCGHQSSVLAQGQSSSPRRSPRLYRTELERGDLPVSGKCPGKNPSIVHRVGPGPGAQIARPGPGAHRVRSSQGAHQSPLLSSAPQMLWTSPIIFFGGATRHGPQKPRICHGRPRPLIHHGRPRPLIHHGRPSPRNYHGRPNSLLHHWSRNRHRPGGHLSCLHVPWGLQSTHHPSPLDVVRRGTRLLGGGGGVMSDLCPHVLCLPSSCAHTWSFLFPIHY